MSIFFEKLTASRPKTAGIGTATADIGIEGKRTSAALTKPAPQIEESSSKIRAEVDSRAPLVEEENINIAEEEGELTVDIYDHNDVIVIQSTVAGVKPEDLEVSITSDMVSIKGTRQPSDHISEEHYYYKELFWGTFARTIILPEEIDEHHTEAILKHGLLTISLPKKKKGLAHAQKVKIKTA